ncbi:TPA: SDR family NAD(P)-dependent oxidoreductase [Vibrio cholerae]
MHQYALITGGSRGIGKSIAEYFAKQNFSLILVANNPDNLSEAKSDILSRHPQCDIETVSVDFRCPSDLQQVIKSLLSRYEKINAMVNCAGILKPGNTQISLNDLTELINTNLTSNILICNMVVEKMKAQGFGEVYNLGSTAGLEPVSKIAIYSATKAAIVSYSRSLYDECLPFRIKICCLCPSVVDTDMTNDGRIKNDLKISPEDLHQAVSFIRKLSPGAAMQMLSIRCTIIDLENSLTTYRE